MKSKWLILPLLILSLQSCFTSSNGGDHGTDLPNSLSLQVLDQNRSATSGARVYAWVRNAQGDTVYNCTSNAEGRCKFELNLSDSVVMISASRRFTNSAVDSLRLGFLPAPTWKSGDPLQLVLGQSTSAQLSMGSDSALRSGFAQYLEITPSTQTDLNSPQWNAAQIKTWLDAVRSRGAQGLSYPLFYSGSMLDSTGLPFVGDSAQSRIRWILDQAKQRDLALRFVLFSNQDGKLAKVPWSDSLGGSGWARKGAYDNVVLPIAIANCDSNNVCFDNFQIEISDDAALLESKYKGSNVQWFSWWFVSAVWMSVGTGFDELNPGILSGTLGSFNPQKLSFITVNHTTRYNPLLFPAEMLSLGHPTMVRWKSAHPSSADLQKLKALNYVGWIESL